MNSITEKPKRQAQIRLSLTGWTVLLAVGYGLFTRGLFSSNFASGFLTTISLGFLCFVPLAIGGLSVFFLNRQEDESWLKAIGYPWLPSLIFIAAVTLFNLEAAICVVIAAPLFCGIASIGGLVMHWILKLEKRGKIKKNSDFSVLVVLLILPYLVTPLESRIRTLDSIRVVNTQIRIHASEQAIWQNIIRVPEIQPGEQHPTLFHMMGVPEPVEATLSREGVGGLRHATFSDGLTFIETVTDWQPLQRISFTIRVARNQPVPPPFDQIGGQYFEVMDGTYTLEPLANGDVILHLSSTERLTTPFNWYSGMWTDFIMRDLQDYILGIVKARAESVR
jgi:hypothetical protein